MSSTYTSHSGTTSIPVPARPAFPFRHTTDSVQTLERRPPRPHENRSVYSFRAQPTAKVFGQPGPPKFQLIDRPPPSYCRQSKATNTTFVDPATLDRLSVKLRCGLSQQSAVSQRAEQRSVLSQEPGRKDAAMAKRVVKRKIAKGVPFPQDWQ